MAPGDARGLPRLGGWSGATHDPHPPEVYERAVSVFVEHRREHPSRWAAVTSAATTLAVTTPAA